ncbi:uncharacterized protein LOC135385719 [Ornithodoros turicata]|uniref:uncharacterized protein LOC135385719 n=1 Tax=Ornithodoros turicata TaxID=34597 RepID=UPI00313A328C
MGLSKKEAFKILELEQGASADEIELSYKQLALMWHPTKHNGSSTSVQNFEKLCQAYSALTDRDGAQKDSLTLDDMAALFQKAFNIGDSDDSSCDSCYGDVDGRQYCVNHKDAARAALHNGNELIAQEQKEKAQAQRKKSKKKKRRERKRQLKEQQEQGACAVTQEEHKVAILSGSEEKSKSSDGDQEEDDLDPNSAFVAAALNRKGRQGLATQAAPAVTKETKQEEEMSKANVMQSRELALQGNEMANQGLYKEAINLITQAIKLYSVEHRYFGNRSYCFYCLEKYDKALKDAEHAIELAPTWPKGYFRRGRAQVGLGLLNEAQRSFEEVLRLDPNCEEAVQELHAARLLVVCEAGFSENDARLALSCHGWKVEEAIDALLMDSASAPAAPRPLRPTTYPLQPPDVKMNPSNPNGLCSIWVGNVRPEVTEKMLTALFKMHGDIQSIRVMHERHCAFINYTNSTAAGRAMDALQGKELCGTRLLIRFPDNAFADRGSGVLVLKKQPVKCYTTTCRTTNKPAENSEPKPKIKGPVNGDECYFWRTTGCSYGEHCRYRHVPKNQGIDRKAWPTK